MPSFVYLFQIETSPVVDLLSADTDLFDQILVDGPVGVEDAVPGTVEPGLYRSIGHVESPDAPFRAAASFQLFHVFLAFLFHQSIVEHVVGLALLIAAT